MKSIYKIIIFILLILPINVVAMELPELYSKNVILYDLEDEEILYSAHAEEVINIASLTKVMTTIVAIEHISNLYDTVTITQSMLNEVPYDASVAGLKAGDVVTFMDLLYAAMLPSGADATTALAYAISGSSRNFVDLMNEKAKSLELTNTNFVNVTGYHAENHYSTAQDVLKYLLYALDNGLFYKIYTTREYTLTNGLEVKSTLVHHQNSKKYKTASILGSKTGFTSKAGLCMSSIIQVTDKKMLLLTFGAVRDETKTAYHMADATTVIKYLNKNYKYREVYKKGTTLFKIPTIDSKDDYYEVKASGAFKNYTNKINNDEKGFEYDVVDSISYNTKKGTKLGTIYYYYEDEFYTEDIYLEKDIEISYIKYFISHIYFFVPIILSVLLLIVIFRTRKKRKRLKKKKHII